MQGQQALAAALLSAGEVAEAVRWATSANLPGAPAAHELPYAHFENTRNYRPCDLSVTRTHTHTRPIGHPPLSPPTHTRALGYPSLTQTLTISRPPRARTKPPRPSRAHTLMPFALAHARGSFAACASRPCNLSLSLHTHNRLIRHPSLPGPAACRCAGGGGGGGGGGGCVWGGGKASERRVGTGRPRTPAGESVAGSLCVAGETGSCASPPPGPGALARARGLSFGLCGNSRRGAEAARGTGRGVEKRIRGRRWPRTGDARCRLGFQAEGRLGAPAAAGRGRGAGLRGGRLARAGIEVVRFGLQRSVRR